eukprot:12781854-Alexandrium_andersonii.AAC.1
MSASIAVVQPQQPAATGVDCGPCDSGQQVQTSLLLLCHHQIEITGDEQTHCKSNPVREIMLLCGPSCNLQLPGTQWPVQPSATQSLQPSTTTAACSNRR